MKNASCLMSPFSYDVVVLPECHIEEKSIINLTQKLL